jgi:hypothetical protein
MNANNTLGEARAHVRENWEKGLRCPCCGQWVQRYAYSLHSGMARVLILVYHADKINLMEGGDGWIHVENYLVDVGVKIKGVHGKLRHWGLLEQKPNDDPKKHDSGIWRITDKGRQFVEGTILVPKKVLMYNERFLGFDGEDISIRQALGKRFDYTELMNGGER